MNKFCNILNILFKMEIDAQAAKLNWHDSSKIKTLLSEKIAEKLIVNDEDDPYT